MHYIVQSGVLRSHVVCPSSCLSVCLSVTLVDQYHRLEFLRNKLHGQLAQHLCSSLTKGHPPTPRKTRAGVGKVACWSTKAAISLRRVEIEEKLLWRAYRKSQTLFRTVPSPTPKASRLLFPKIGGSQPHPKFQSLLSH